MPVYSFKRLDNDEIVEQFIPVDQLDDILDENRCIVLQDGTKAVKYCIADFEHQRQVTGDWRVESISLGLDHPDEVKPAMERARAQGCFVEFNEKLRPVFTSERDFRKYQDVCGVRNHQDYTR